MSRLLVPPRLRTFDSPVRHATWLELFFDLVFVVAVAELADELTEAHDVRGFLEFLVLFVPVWWAWAGFAYYANRFDTDDLVYRVLTLTGMFAVAALATNVHHAFSGGARGFALAYVCVRLVLVLLYARAARHVPDGRRLALWYAGAFSVAIVVWLISRQVEPPGRWWLWALALAIEISAPLVGWRLIRRAPIHPTHIPHRYGLLTIIVLGESVFAVVVGVVDAQWKTESVLAAGGGFVIAATLWWIYFEFVDSEAVVRSLLGGLTYTYAHFPLVAGIAALGGGVKLAILAGAGRSEYDGTGWILCAGLALTMFALALLEFVTPPTHVDTDVWLRVATGAVALALVPVADAMSPPLLVWILALVLGAQVLYELATHERHARARAAGGARTASE